VWLRFVDLSLSVAPPRKVFIDGGLRISFVEVFFHVGVEITDPHTLLSVVLLYIYVVVGGSWAQFFWFGGYPLISCGGCCGGLV